MNGVKSLIDKDIRKGMSRAKMLSNATSTLFVESTVVGDSKKEKRKEKGEKSKKKREKAPIVPAIPVKRSSVTEKPKKVRRIVTPEERKKDLLEWTKQQTDYVPVKLPQMTPGQERSIMLFREIIGAEERRNK